MTIAIVVKVGDGVVLGSDSAGTLSNARGVANVYFNAEKLSNLVKGLPIGMVCYGLGGLDGRSIASLAKDLPTRLSGSDPAWGLDPRSYSIEEVAHMVRRFFYEEYYQKEYPKSGVDVDGNPTTLWDSMGFFIAGFSAGEDHAEVWSLKVDDAGNCLPPVLDFGKQGAGTAAWAGAPEALNRRVKGWSSQVYRGLLAAGVSAAATERFLDKLPVEPLINSAMPLQDAIDLVRFMVDVTVGFVRFVPGPPMVAEPVDLARSRNTRASAGSGENTTIRLS